MQIKTILGKAKLFMQSVQNIYATAVDSNFYRNRENYTCISSNSYLVSTCNKSQPWVSLYCPLGETGILREQLLPVTEDILHFKVFPNEVKAPVFIKIDPT